MKLKSLGMVLVMAWVASSCGEELPAPGVELAPESSRTTRQVARSTNKVLILDSTVTGGLGSREARAVRAHAPSAQLDVVSPAEWRAMTAEQFMSYRAIILGDAVCQSGTAALQAAVDTRNRWGAIVDGVVVILSTDPTHNATERVVENAIQAVLGSAQYRTGMYIALGCAYQDAPAHTAVPLLEPFGAFNVQGVPGCASSGHVFAMSPQTLSANLSDVQLRGDGCAARSVFTGYPNHTFAYAAIATSLTGDVIPGQQTYIDYQVEPEVETPFVGTPYLLVRGAMAQSAGCGDTDYGQSREQCELGDNLNGQPASPGQDPLETCSFSCHLNWCGDGVVDAASGEECDSGVNNGRTTDSEGNIGACTSFCKLPNIPSPNRPPVALCRDVTVAATNTCGVPADINNGSSDPDGDPVSCVQNAPGPYAIGTTTVTLTCSDPQGLSGTCTGTVTVTDDTPPTLVLAGSARQMQECGTPYSDPGATARDICAGDLTDRITRTGAVDPAVPGSYTIHYSVSDPSNHTVTASRQVSVADTQPPSIVCPEPIVVESLEGALVSVTPRAARATDTCSQARVSSPAQTRFPVGTTVVVYTATDEAGNSSSCISTITVLELVPPGTGVAPPLPESLDNALLGGGNGCSSTGSGPSSLALMGLGVLAALLSRKRARPGLLVLTGLLVGVTASAQPQGVPTFELELLKLNPSGQGSLLLGTGELLPEGDYRFSLTTHYQKDPLVLFQNGTRVGVVVRHRATAHLAAAYGLWGWLELGAQVPVVLFQRGDDLTARGFGQPEGGPAAGTPLFNLQMKVLAQAEEDLVDLSLGVQAGPAVGSAAALAREVRATPSLMVGRRFDDLRMAFDAGVLLRPRTVLTPDANVQDELGHALRLGGVLSSLGEGLRGELAVTTLVPLKRQGYSVEALTGARWPVSDSVEAYGLGGVGFGSAPGTPDFRVLLGMAYGRPRPARVELARYEPAPPELAPTDMDGDGLLDDMDRCPAVAGLPGFQGCPDQDGDGVEDEVDQCPSEAGLVERQGCPTEDSDVDGFLDEVDACPTEAGIPEMQGCPAQDQDNDTVEDHRDNCPDEAGPVDNQGCPAEEKQLVVIQQDRIKINDKIHFDFDKATIQPRSFPLLDQVARILLEHPEILSVTVEGHTDNQGPADYNRTLSQRRAESVSDYLAQKGVARERLEARGFGEDRPLQPNTTNAGRAANRRVEFITRYTQAGQ